MDVVENTLDIPVADVLAEPLFCFLAQATTEGHPRVSPLWYRWEEESVWIIADSEKSYTDRVAAQPHTAVAVVDFDIHTGTVHHVGMRGLAELVPIDEARADRLLERYLGPDRDEWDPRFVGLDADRWQFIRFDPETVVARDQSIQPSLPE